MCLLNLIPVLDSFLVTHVVQIVSWDSLVHAAHRRNCSERIRRRPEQAHLDSTTLDWGGFKHGLIGPLLYFFTHAYIPPCFVLRSLGTCTWKSLESCTLPRCEDE